MSSLADLLHRGGPALWVVMMLGVAAPLVAGMCVWLARAGRRVPVGAAFVLPVSMVIVGALGTWSGMRQVVLAIASASSEMRGVLAHAGASMALVSEVAGLGAAGLFLCFFGVLAAGMTAHARGDHGPAIVAEYRVGAAVALTLGVLAGGLALRLSGEVQVHEAMARSSLEVMGTLVAAGLGQQKLGLVLAVASVAVGAVAGLACMPVLPHLDWRRLGGSLSGVALGLGVAGGLHGMSRAVAAPLASTWAYAVLEGVDEVVPRRPNAVDARGKHHALPAAWGLASVRVWRGGQWQPWSASPPASGAEGGGPHLLVAAPETPADTLFSGFRPSEDAGVVVLVQPVGGGLEAERAPELDVVRHRGLQLRWARSLPPDPAETGALFVLETGKGVVVMAGGEQLARESGVAGARSALAAYMDGVQGRDGEVWLHPGPGWTLQDVVSLCLTGRDPMAPRTRGGCGVVGSSL